MRLMPYTIHGPIRDMPQAAALAWHLLTDGILT